MAGQQFISSANRPKAFTISEFRTKSKRTLRTSQLQNNYTGLHITTSQLHHINTTTTPTFTSQLLFPYTVHQGTPPRRLVVLCCDMSCAVVGCCVIPQQQA
jgi:hypothetical protein